MNAFRKLVKKILLLQTFVFVQNLIIQSLTQHLAAYAAVHQNSIVKHILVPSPPLPRLHQPGSSLGHCFLVTAFSFLLPAQSMGSHCRVCCCASSTNTHVCLRASHMAWLKHLTASKPCSCHKEEKIRY